MSSNNLLALSFKLYKANRKKSRFIKVIVFIIFILVLFFVNTLFSSFEKNIPKSDFEQPIFIATKVGGTINLQKNIPIRKICVQKEVKQSVESLLDAEYDVKEGLIFSTYFTEIKSKNSGNVVVQLVDSSSIDSNYLQKNEQNSNKNRAIPIYVNSAFQNTFDMKEDYLVYINDFFGNTIPLRMRAEYCIMAGTPYDRQTAYVDINLMKQFLSIPEDLSLPLFISKNKKIDIFTPQYLKIKKEVGQAATENNVAIQPFHAIDTNTNEIFSLYIKVLFSVVIAVILILLYAMSISYYINFNTRKRDFAIFRSFGLTNNKLYWLMFLENFYTCITAFVTSVVLNIIIGLCVKELRIGYIILSFSFTYPGIIVLFIILLLTSFISVLKAYRHIVKGSSLNSLLERK